MSFPTDPVVLVVEDEPGVRAVARLGLQTAGFRVLEAPDGATAIRMSHGRADPIHLLLTDVHLPDMSGDEVAVAVRSRHPEAKILLTSGQPLTRSDPEPYMYFLAKPFTPTTLVARVRAVLDD